MQTFTNAPDVVTNAQLTLILQILNNALSFLVLVVLIINARRNGK